MRGAPICSVMTRMSPGIASVPCRTELLWLRNCVSVLVDVQSSTVKEVGPVWCYSIVQLQVNLPPGVVWWAVLACWTHIQDIHFSHWQWLTGQLCAPQDTLWSLSMSSVQEPVWLLPFGSFCLNKHGDPWMTGLLILSLCPLLPQAPQILSLFSVPDWLILLLAYRLYTVVPRLVKFVDVLTNWYVRMNRRRLKVSPGCFSEDQKV